jgi:fusaric acid resistance family protein
VRGADAEVEPDTRATLIYSVALGLSALGCYWFALHVVNPIHEVTPTGDTIGALWAAISTVFVYRHSYDESASAALTRISGTGVSFVLCLIYLVLFPFHLWAIAVLIAIGAFVLAAAGRPQDTMPASLATLVVLVIA